VYLSSLVPNSFCSLDDLYLEKSLVGELNGIDFVTAAAFHAQHGIFQAILASPPRHPLIGRALSYARDWVVGTIEIPDGLWMGPILIGRAIHELYNISDFEDRQDLLCKGALLFKEIDAVNEMPPERQNVGWCSIGFVDPPPNSTLYGFSRVKQGEVVGVFSCLREQPGPQ
jgi:hypothetical protein